jgi:hypothetical protein
MRLGFIVVLLICLSVVLLAACDALTGGQPEPTATPTLLPSLTPTASPTAAQIPTATPDDPLPQAEPEETPAVEDIQMIIEAAAGQEIDPPIEIVLPEGWGRFNATQVIQDIAGPYLVPFSVYTGPVTGGDGYIILLWGFGSLSRAVNPLLAEEGDFEPDLWADGVRLLRLAVVEPGCNIGTDVRREFAVGGLPAAGTYFSVVDCPETVDTRGWLAGLRQDGMNFLFYAYTEPITAMDGSAHAELQAVLDSVTFRVEDLLDLAVTPTPAP